MGAATLWCLLGEVGGASAKPAFRAVGLEKAPMKRGFLLLPR